MKNENNFPWVTFFTCVFGLATVVYSYNNDGVDNEQIKYIFGVYASAIIFRVADRFFKKSDILMLGTILASCVGMVWFGAWLFFNIWEVWFDHGLTMADASNDLETPNTFSVTWKYSIPMGIPVIVAFATVKALVMGVIRESKKQDVEPSK